MPKEIINLTLQRSQKNEKWGFVMIGGKDQALTVKVGKVRPYSPAEKCGLKPGDYIWTINGKEVFEMSHKQCEDCVKNAPNSLALSIERGDHIVPNFEEIWPSKKKAQEKAQEKDKNYNYYLDAMKNGPDLPGHLPLPSNFTTVGKPQIFVNQYDNPIEVYSEDTIEEMKDERLTAMKPELAELANIKRKDQGRKPLAEHPFSKGGKKFDSKKSNVLNMIDSRGK